MTRLQQGGASLRPASQTALLGKDLELQGLSFAWWPGNNPEDRQQVECLSHLFRNWYCPFAS